MKCSVDLIETFDGACFDTTCFSYSITGDFSYSITGDFNSLDSFKRCCLWSRWWLARDDETYVLSTLVEDEDTVDANL